MKLTSTTVVASNFQISIPTILISHASRAIPSLQKQLSLLINDTLPPSSNPNLSLTNTSIHIGLENSAVYKSPNTPLLASDLDVLLNTNFDSIIAEDLNAKHSSWNSRVINANSQILHKQ